MKTPTLPIHFSKESIIEILTDREKDQWEFYPLPVDDIPAPDSENQDYDFSALDCKKFKAVTVPSSLEMQGFAVKNNTEYYYRRSIDVPSAEASERIYIRFEGVYSNARIWINGKFIRSHTGGFTPFDCDITAFSGKTVTLVAGVADIEGKEKGTYNPQGKMMSDASWASYYAHHNVCGILRDAVLFKIHEKHLKSFITETIPDELYENWKICIHCAKADDVHLRFTLLDKKGITIAEKNCFSEKCEIDVTNPKKWNAEKPYLYTLRTELFDDKNCIQVLTKKIGFRHICYGGMNGTDKNKIYINGKEIKLRGVCRHDVSFLHGRSLSREETQQELEAYKNCNINFLRTSHYPASEYLLQLADSMGFYVEQENAACFKGANGFGVDCPDCAFTDEFAEMIACSRNHPSVLIWSLANESDFEKTSAFRKEYDYVKKADATRPVIFSYPNTVKSKPLPYDIFSFHYQKIHKNMGRRDIPVLHDEFAHIPCYNTEFLKKDNSSRVFWAESILKGWDKIYRTDGALGCAIWAARDDVFFIPENIKEKHQTHSSGSAAGYGEWGVVLDSFGREKPEAYILKKAFSPVKISNFKINKKQISFNAQNRFFHTNLSEIALVCKIDGETVFNGLIPNDTEPKSTAEIIINTDIDTFNVISVEFLLNGLSVEKFEHKAPKKENEQKNKDYIAKAFCADKIKLFSERKGLCGKHIEKFRLSLKENGNKLFIKLTPLTLSALFSSGNNHGVRIPLGENVSHISWNTKPFSIEFPDNHIGRTNGDCFADDFVLTPYREKPDCKWSKDAFNYFLFDKSENRPLVSNDFKTKRTDIIFYRIFMKNGNYIEVRPNGSVTNCLVDARLENGKKTYFLEITFGRFYRDLEWGNYYGKKLKPADNLSLKAIITEYVKKQTP